MRNMLEGPILAAGKEGKAWKEAPRRDPEGEVDAFYDAMQKSSTVGPLKANRWRHLVWPLHQTKSETVLQSCGKLSMRFVPFSSGYWWLGIDRFRPGLSRRYVLHGGRTLAARRRPPPAPPMVHMEIPELATTKTSRPRKRKTTRPSQYQWNRCWREQGQIQEQTGMSDPTRSYVRSVPEEGQTPTGRRSRRGRATMTTTTYRSHVVLVLLLGPGRESEEDGGEKNSDAEWGSDVESDYDPHEKTVLERLMKEAQDTASAGWKSGTGKKDSNPFIRLLSNLRGYVCIPF
jgi:hypothetical protein